MLLSVIRGARRGALKMLFGILSWIFVLAFVILATPRIDNFLTYKTPLGGYVQEEMTKQAEARWEKQRTEVAKQLIDDLKQQAGRNNSLLGVGGQINASTQVEMKQIGELLNQNGEDFSGYLPRSLQSLLGQSLDLTGQLADLGKTSISNAVDQVGKSIADSAALAMTAWVMRLISFLLALVLANVIVLIIRLLIDA